MKAIKISASVLFMITMLIGLILMITETPDTASISTIIKVNGGGTALFCVSLLILYILNGKESEEEWQ